jgi:tripartite-type tricarboxylate transporter receptor subunit TctC
MVLQKKLLIPLAVCLLLVSIIIGGCTEMSSETTTITKQYPSRPITMIVPFSAGGGSDLLARSLEKVSIKYLGQPLLILNKPGGTGAVGYNELVNSSPDGYTLGISGTELILQPLYGQTKYNYLTDLTPIVQISASPYAMVVSADQPWQNVHKLIEYAKQHPGKLKFGHAGLGGVAHVTGEAFAKNANISIEQVPFSGGSEVVAALLGKHIEIAFINPSIIKEYVENGKLKILASSSKARQADPVLAQIPTFKEQGFDIIFDNRIGVVAPKELPPEIETKLAEGFKAMISDPEFKSNMDALGVEIEYLDPKDFKDQWLADNTKLTKIVQETGILNKIKGEKK